MSWRITPTQPIPAVIGEPFGGGFFAGYISHTANGSPTHALIVAPRATGASGTSYTITTSLEWKTSSTETAGTDSSFDGAANTAAMVTAGIANHPAANFCVGLSIGGFTDWYLPARFELEIAYFHLKPTTASNTAGIGINDYSVPKRTANYTAGNPNQTSVSVFQDTGSEPFVNAGHWSSTEASAANAWILGFGNGGQVNTGKANGVRVRAFRRIAL